MKKKKKKKEDKKANFTDLNGKLQVFAGA